MLVEANCNKPVYSGKGKEPAADSAETLPANIEHSLSFRTLSQDEMIQYALTTKLVSEPHSYREAMAREDKGEWPDPHGWTTGDGRWSTVGRGRRREVESGGEGGLGRGQRLG